MADRRFSEPFDARTVKGSHLDTVAYTRELIDRSHKDFSGAVKDAQKVGCSVREIAKAAGYSSTSSIQRILKS